MAEDAWTENKSEVSFTLKPAKGTGDEWVTYRGQDLEQILAAAERDLDRGLYTRIQKVGAGYRAEYNLAANLGAAPVPQAELDQEAAGLVDARTEKPAADYQNVQPIWFNVPFGKNKEAKAAGLQFSKTEKKWGTPMPDVAKAAEAAGFTRKG